MGAICNIMCRFFANPLSQSKPVLESDIEKPFLDKNIMLFHRSLPDYLPTTTHTLKALANKLNIGSLLVKDESTRFDLKAFKILGASWAIKCWLEQELSMNLPEMPDLISKLATSNNLRQITLTTATDGNHGRAVARMARWLSLPAVIYMPSDTVSSRIENIRNEGAKVVIVDGSYDDAVRQVRASADKNGWQIISDTSWEGYETIPRHVIAGYQTLFNEQSELFQNIDIVLIQGGVGAITASTAYYFTQVATKRPYIISVEPNNSACLFESACATTHKEDCLISIKGSPKTIMAGLNCGTASRVAWPIIRNAVDLFITIPDTYATQAIKLLHFAGDNDQQIESGESGSAGLGGLLALLNEPDLEKARNTIGLSDRSNVLIINTEGATDPASYRQIIEKL